MTTQRVAGARSGRTPLAQSIRFNVLRRDNFTCRYCGRSSPDVVLHVDHVHPVSRGGGNSENNLVTACVDCNGGKGAHVAVRVPALRRKGRGGRHAEPNMVGLFGLSFDNGKPVQQFSIERTVGGGAYAVQTYDWKDGSAGEALIMDGTFLRSEQCRLFLTVEAWHKVTNDVIARLSNEDKRNLDLSVEWTSTTSGLRLVVA